MGSNKPREIYFSKKRWIYCPTCKTGRQMIFQESLWKCCTCNQLFSLDIFYKKTGFWLCNKCGSFLNGQETFVLNSPSHKCEICDTENSTIPESVLKVCRGCGKILLNKKKRLCSSCEELRDKKIQTVLETTVLVAGTLSSLLGVVSNLSSSKSLSQDSTIDLKSMSTEDLKKYRAEVWNTWRYQENGPEREANWDLMKNKIDSELTLRSIEEFNAKYPDWDKMDHERWTDKNRWEKD